MPQFNYIIATQNIWGFPNIFQASNNLFNLINVYIELDVDILLLQEVFRESWLNKCNNINEFYTPFYLNNPLFIEGGLVILIKKNLVKNLRKRNCNFKLQFHEFEKQGVFNSRQAVSYLSRKGFLELKIYNHKNSYNIVNVHTTSAFSEKLKYDDKQNLILKSQLNQLFAYTNIIKDPIVLIGGDFNKNIIDSTYTLFQNSFEIFPKAGITHNSTKNLIDFIIFKKNNKLFSEIPNFTVVQQTPFSDHDGIIGYVKIY
jgi:hypothetical protein